MLGNRRGLGAVELILAGSLVATAAIIFSKVNAQIPKAQWLLTAADEQRTASRAMDLMVKDLKEAFDASFSFANPVRLAFSIREVDPATGLPRVRGTVVWELVPEGAGSHGTLIRTWNGVQQSVLRHVRVPQAGSAIFNPVVGSPDLVSIHFVYEPRFQGAVVMNRRVLIRKSES
jgi:hypothetical protein